MAASSRLVAVSLASLLLLSGCAPERTPAPGESESPSPSATPSPSTSTPPPPEATPVSVACTGLVSDQVIYDWGNGNWASDADFRPVSNSPAATAVEQRGTACGWVHLTSGAQLAVSVAQPSSETLAAIKAEIANESEAVATFGVEGYFSGDSEGGVAHVFTGPYWISAESEYFLEPGDAGAIISAALEAF